jgi:hypothetical protein
MTVVQMQQWYQTQSWFVCDGNNSLEYMCYSLKRCIKRVYLNFTLCLSILWIISQVSLVWELENLRLEWPVDDKITIFGGGKFSLPVGDDQWGIVTRAALFWYILGVIEWYGARRTWIHLHKNLENIMWKIFLYCLY